VIHICAIFGWNGGHVNGARDVIEPQPIKQPGKCLFTMSCTKEWSVCVCVCPILLQPRVICVSPVSELRFEPCLHNCWISCYVYRSIEMVRSSQIIWCHHVQWIILQLMPEMWILLWPEHHILVTSTVICGTFITEKNLLAGCGTWELSSKAQHVAPIHAGTLQFIHKSWAIQPQLSSLSSHGLTFLTTAY
jgi:hypothetical protein